jgi:hypothetical protein
MIPDPLAALGGRRIGAHLPLGGGMVKAAQRAREIGATAIQVFADNPTAWRRRQADRVPALAALDITPLATHRLPGQFAGRRGVLAAFDRRLAAHGRPLRAASTSHRLAPRNRPGRAGGASRRASPRPR